MSFTSRITEYGLLGAFFLVAQLAMILLVFPAETINQMLVPLKSFEFISDGSVITASTVNSFLTVLALISIFFVGLLIDLVGYYFPIVEVSSLRKTLSANEKWIVDFFHEHDEYIGIETKNYIEEYQQRSALKALSEAFKDIPFTKKFWKVVKENWKRASLSNTYKLFNSYKKIMNLLTYYCVVSDKVTNPQIILDQMHVWRIAKGISVSLILLSFEFLLIAQFNLKLYIIIISSIGYILAYTLAFGFAKRAHNQLCESLVACSYLIRYTNISSNKA